MEEFKRIIKNSNVYGRLNKKAQSYLFCSFDPLALNLAAACYIENESGVTFHKDLSSPHPDIIILPEGEKVLTADIALLTSSAHATPLSLEHKYYILKNAETMNDSAANKLLKTLEEPPKHVKVFILADSENSVAATIRSRCQILRLDSLELPQDSTLNGELHLNSISRLKKAQSGLFNEPLKTAVNTLLFLRKSPQIILYVQSFSEDKDKLKEIIGMLELVLHDCMTYHSNGQIRLKSFRSDIAKIASFYNLDSLIRLEPVLLKAKKRLSESGNLNSIADELLFSLLSVRQKHAD